MNVEVDPDDVDKYDADDRGRIYLGSEYADLEGIEVAVLNDPTDPDRRLIRTDRHRLFP